MAASVAEELAALQSIYSSDFQLQGERTFKITVQPVTGGSTEENRCSALEYAAEMVPSQISARGLVLEHLATK